jgi:hypothetical protein
MLVGLFLIVSMAILSACESLPMRPTEVPPAVPQTPTQVAEEPTTVAPESDTGAPETALSARDQALAFVRDAYGNAAPVVDLEWVERRMTPEGMVGAETYQYSAEDWVLTISYPIVQPELTAYRVVLSNASTAFQWEGEVDAEGSITETGEEVPEPADPVMAARDAALAYLSEEHGPGTPTTDMTWTRARTTPDNVVGSETYEYRSGHWLVTVSYPVVPPDKTVYKVLATNQETGFQWEGQVAADGAVTEILAPVTGQPVVGWFGQVVSAPEGAQYDDYLVLAPEDVGEVGLAGVDEDTEAQIVALRDSSKYAHFWGTLTADVPDHGGYQLLVTRLRIDEAGPESEADPVEAWEGIIWATREMAQYDDYFALSGDLPVRFGIESDDPALAAQLEALRDTQTPVRVWGRLTCGVIDVNACQISVIAIAIVGEPPAEAPAAVDGWAGTIRPLPAGSEYDDYFEREDGQHFGIGSVDEDMHRRIGALRTAGAPVRVWGQLLSDVPDVEGRQILLERYELVQEAQSTLVEGWEGTIVAMDSGAQYDDYFERDNGERYGIETPDAKLARRLEMLRDEGARVQVWGELLSDVPDVENRQILVVEVEVIE